MKTLKCVPMSTVKSFLLLILGFIASINFTHASTVIKVSLTTGGDDLRGGGNTAHITFNFADGTTSPEYNLGGGFAMNSVVTKNITITPNITNLNQVTSVMIRHNGSPRAEQPFDTYDNWDLQRLRVSFVIGNVEQIIVNESGNPIVRFTGQMRNRVFKPTPPAPDYGDATKTVKVFLTTGSDDLRGGGNQAYMTVHYTDGTSSSEYPLGGGFGQNSAITKVITINKLVKSTEEIQKITIRHDGSPRAGQPFDTYDNWDLQVLRVVLVMSDKSEKNMVNERGNPLVRFTGAERVRTYERKAY
jgi:hypothetical protein